MGCTQQKVDKVESLRDAYFQIAEKIVNKEEISSKYIKKLKEKLIYLFYFLK